MYNIFVHRVPDNSNLATEEVKFNLFNVSVGLLHCWYFDEGDLNRTLEYDRNI